MMGGPNNKDYSILGSYIGSRYFGKLPYIIDHLHCIIHTIFLSVIPHNM